jgi:hypothetical protein
MEGGQWARLSTLGVVQRVEGINFDFCLVTVAVVIDVARALQLYGV